MSSGLRTSPRGTPQPAATKGGGEQPRAKGGRFGSSSGKRTKVKKSGAAGARASKPRARDHHATVLYLPSAENPPRLAQKDCLDFEGEQQQRRTVIEWKWRSLGCPGPDDWDTLPGPSQVRGTVAEIACCMGMLDEESFLIGPELIGDP